MIKKFIRHELLAKHTTFKIGGPAEYFFEAKTVKDLVDSIGYARNHQIPFLVLGNGSNVLISDKGIRGLVIKNSTSIIKLLNNNQVKLDSGVFLPKAIFYLLNQGITGLESFVGIPATVGGATYTNLHGQDKLWSDYLVSATLFGKNNQIKSVPNRYFKFAYDYSILHQTEEIVLTCTIKLNIGSKEEALSLAKKYQQQKSHYPQISAGCIFQNLTSSQQQKLNLPYPSTGYLIDKVLKLKGKQIGQARISNQHAGYIENLKSAKAKDVLQLIKLVKDTAKSKLNLNLKLEINMLGDL